MRFHAGLHLALRDPRTLGNVDSHNRANKFTQNRTFAKKIPKFVLKILWVRAADPK